MSDNFFLNDDELAEVSAGAGYVKTNNSTTRSGDTPLYHVGEMVEIKWEPRRGGFEPAWHKYIVSGVSSSPNGGWIFKEFTYTLKNPSTDFTLEGVYESCLRKAQD